MMETINIKKWGNSAGVRIPSAMIKAANLELDAPVNVSYDSGKIIIEPVIIPKQDLSMLLKAVTPENMHHEVSAGDPQGDEIW